MRKLNSNKCKLIFMLSILIFFTSCATPKENLENSTEDISKVLVENNQEKNNIPTVGSEKSESKLSFSVDGGLPGWSIIPPNMTDDTLIEYTLNQRNTLIFSEGDTDYFWSIYSIYKAVLIDYVWNDMNLMDYENSLNNLGLQPFDDRSSFFFTIENQIHVERLSQEEIDLFKKFAIENSIVVLEPNSIDLTENNIITQQLYNYIKSHIPKELKEIVIDTYKNVTSFYPLDLKIPEDSDFLLKEKPIGYGAYFMSEQAGIYDLAISYLLYPSAPTNWKELLEGKNPNVYIGEVIAPKVEQDLSEKLDMSVSVFIR